MAKKFVKLCKEYHTFFEGLQVPVGAIYGRTHINNEEIFWVCDCPGEIKGKSVHVYMMKRTWNANQGCSIQRTTWHKSLIGESHVIFMSIHATCKGIGGIPKVKTYLPEERKPKVRMPLEYKYTIGLRKNYGPETEREDYEKECERIHERETHVPWDERVHDEDYEYLGCPVEYKRNKPKIEGKSTNNCFGRFDGVGSPRRDGLKVPQSKCKPGKSVIV